MIDAGLQIGAQVLGLAIAVILHEVAHGYVALRLGDPTAKYAGRLTLNPIKHIDLFGTIIIPLVLYISNAGFMFGWAKPVPVNYYNLRGRYGPVLVALAGPATNFALAIIFGLLTRLASPDTALPYLLSTLTLINAILMLFNLIPLPPLDGSKVLYLFLDRRPDIIQILEHYSLYIFMILLVIGQPLLQSIVFTPAVILTSWLTGSLGF